MQNKHTHEDGTPFTKEEFLQKLKTDKEFNDEFGNKGIDQISELIRLLKETPDSRRMVVNAWAVHDLDKMVLPPCHYGFQCYTRELSLEERKDYAIGILGYESLLDYGHSRNEDDIMIELMHEWDVPTRAISLSWNQRSVDTPLGLPFNIASYGLLLIIIGKMVNMVPEELIGNLGDTHIYSNQIEGVKEQIGRELSLEERNEWHLINRCGGNKRDCKTDWKDFELDQQSVPKRTREPYKLPTLSINSGNENWHLLGLDEILNTLDPDITFKIKDYQSHPKIDYPLSN